MGALGGGDHPLGRFERDVVAAASAFGSPPPRPLVHREHGIRARGRGEVDPVPVEDRSVEREVGREPCLRDRRVAGEPVLRHRELQEDPAPARFGILERVDLLHRALAVRSRAEDHGAIEEDEIAREDLRRGRGTRVEQHHDRQLGLDALGLRFHVRLEVRHLPATASHRPEERPLLEEEVRTLGGLEHRAARVPSEVDHDAGRTRRAERLDRFAEQCDRLLAEVIDPHEHGTPVELAPRHVRDHDLGADQRDVRERIGECHAHRERDRAVRRAADALGRLRDRHAGGRGPVDAHDAIPGLEPRVRGRTAWIHFADHELTARILAERAPDPRELPGDAFVETLETFIGEEARVRVERRGDALEHLDLEVESRREVTRGLHRALEPRERRNEIEHARPFDAKRRELAVGAVEENDAAIAFLDDQPGDGPLERLGGTGERVARRERLRMEIVVVHQLERALGERRTRRWLHRERRADEVGTEHAVPRGCHEELGGAKCGGAVNQERFKALLERVAAGDATVAEALRELESQPTGRLGYATLDLHRAARTGLPEVVYGEGKPADRIAGILTEMRAAGAEGMVTRLGEDKAAAIRAIHPDAVWHPLARILHLPSPQRPPVAKRAGTIAVVAAGTSDLPVAEEAAVTAEIFGNPVSRHWDVGVAGIHRILDARDAIQSATVVIVVAGMEGALASVVAGIIDRPIIAVPTSVGYGASFGGIAALLGMLNSCAPGVSVVNIDNGFGAAAQATKINRLLGTT